MTMSPFEDQIYFDRHRKKEKLLGLLLSYLLENPCLQSSSGEIEIRAK